jgi:PAS domain S-box-containing protein
MSTPAGLPADAAFEDAPCGLLLTGTDDVVVRVNSTFLDWTGYERDHVLGRPFHDFLHPGSQAFYATQVLDELWSSTELRGIALRLTRADTSVMPILANASLVGAPDDATGVRLAVFDASSREDLERELILARSIAESSVESVRVLQEAATRFLVALDEVELAAALADVARTAFAASDVAVVTYRDGGRQFDVVAGEHLRPLLEAVRATRPEPVALHVDEIITVSDLDEAFD